MLALGRKRHQSVVIGDEITLTVEEICETGTGERILGATVRLGFQTPPTIPIYRSELRDDQRRKRRGDNSERKSPQQRQNRVLLPDAQVQLRIQVPPKVPVCVNGKAILAVESRAGTSPETHAPRSVYRVTCRINDRIAICNNIMISAIKFHRVVSREAAA